MAENLQPLPREVTDEIRYILEGCRSGRLEHFQPRWHCNTKHCVAGWKEMLDFGKADASYKLGYEDPGEYAQEKWELSDFERSLLFDGQSEFWHQFALLERLEKGERFGDVNTNWVDYLLDISPEYHKVSYEGEIPRSLEKLVDAIIGYQHPKPNPIVEELLNPPAQTEQVEWTGWGTFSDEEAEALEEFGDQLEEILQVGSTKQRH